MVVFQVFKLYKRDKIAKSVANGSKFLSMKWVHSEFDVLLNTWYLVRECLPTNHFSQTFKSTFQFFFTFSMHRILNNYFIETSKFVTSNFFFSENKVFTKVTWTERRLKSRMAKATEKFRKIFKKNIGDRVLFLRRLEV